MKHINDFKIFLEDMNNPNTPQGYINSLSSKNKLSPKTNNNNQQNKNQQTPTDDVDSILQDTEQQKQNIVAKKDIIEKGLLQNIQDLNPENQKVVKTQVNDYRNQIKDFDKAVTQIDNLNKNLKKSNTNNRFKSNIQKSRNQNNL